MKKSSIWRRSIITISVILVAVTAYLVYHYGYIVYQNYTYYTHYENVHGLQRSSQVVLNGVKIGEVSDIELKDRNMVKVTMEIDKDVKIPKGTIALLASKNLMDEKMITLRFSDQVEIYNHKGIIAGRYDTTVLEMRDQIDPIIQSTKYTLSNSKKNLNNTKQEIENGMIIDIRKDIKDAEHTMRDYRKQSQDIKKNAARVTASLKAIGEKTSTLVANKEKINQNIKEAEVTTEKLSEITVAEQLKNISASAKKVEDKTKQADTEGTTSKLINEAETYNDAVKELRDVNDQVKEFKNDPPGISVF